MAPGGQRTHCGLCSWTHVEMLGMLSRLFNVYIFGWQVEHLNSNFWFDASFETLYCISALKFGSHEMLKAPDMSILVRVIALMMGCTMLLCTAFGYLRVACRESNLIEFQSNSTCAFTVSSVALILDLPSWME